MTITKGPVPQTPFQEATPSTPLLASAPSAGSPDPVTAGTTDPAPTGTLKQHAADISQPTTTPSTWQGVMRDLSAVLRSRNPSGETKTLVPDPSEPPPAGPVIEPADHRPGDPPVDASNDASSGPPEWEPIAAPHGFVPITLNLQGADARQALEMLGSNASVNIFVSSGVSGTVTANLRGMSFQEALGAILRLCNLVAHREGNNVFVYPPGDLPQLDRALKVIPLDYTSAEDVVKSITTIKGLLSPVGSVYAFALDDPTKAGQDDTDTVEASDNRKTQEAIVVEDAPSHVLRVEHYIREIDVPPRQVQIQAYILEVVLKDDLKHGVNFEEIIKIAGNTATLRTLGFASTAAFPVPPPDPPPAPSGTGFFAKIDGKTFDAILEALKTTTDAKTLADPKITVLSGQLAHLQIGEQLGYLDTTTQTETAATQSVKFLQLGVILDVTPRITASNQVVMTVKPKVSSGRINPETKLPEEENTEIVTNVMLEDGQGLVIGGLIKEKDSDIQHKVPFLGNLPYVGMLFQERQKQTERTEYIIALLPRVLPYTPCPALKDRLETIRATTPLFHGPLRRCPRPWEPSFRDALPQRGDRL